MTIQDMSAAELLEVSRSTTMACNRKFRTIDDIIAFQEAARAELVRLAELGKRAGRKPDGYAYRYPSAWDSGRTVLVFNVGGKVNASDPIEAIPYWLGNPPFLAERSGWISCSERLPERGVLVLIHHGSSDDFPSIAWRVHSAERDKEWQSTETAPQDEPICFSDDQVTHWQPLPSPPEAGDVL